MADKDNYFSSPDLCVHAIKHRGRFCLHARANSLARKVGNEVLWPLRKWPIPNKLLSSLLSHHRRPVSAGHLFAQQKSRSGGRGRPTASSISPRPDPLPPKLVSSHCPPPGGCVDKHRGGSLDAWQCAGAPEVGATASHTLGADPRCASLSFIKRRGSSGGAVINNRFARGVRGPPSLG